MRAAAQDLESIDAHITGNVCLSFYRADAKPEDIASALSEALPNWHDAHHTHYRTSAWAQIRCNQAEITVHVTDEQDRAYIARQQTVA